MKLSNRQKAMLHWVPDALGISDAQRRLIQRNVGGFHSAADGTVTRQGFIAVMAFYEARSPGGRIRGFTAGYWAAEAAKAGPTDALLFACRRQAHRLGWDNATLEEFLAGRHMSCGQCGELATAPAYWLRRLLDALKAMADRQPKTTQPATACGACARGGP